MQVLGKGVHGADRGAVLLVILAAAGVAVAQVVIADVHFHGAVPHASLQGPVAQGPVGLHERVEAGGGVDFVAGQGAFDAQFGGGVVLVAGAVVLTAVVIQAGDHGQVAGGLADGLQPVHAGAVELAVEVDHAAAAGVGSDTLGNRQVLKHAASAGVGIHLQRRIAKIPLVVHAQLLMIDTLARVVGQRPSRHRTRVGLVRGPGLPQRILRAILLQAAVDQCHLAVVVRLEVDLGERLVTARCAVVAVAVGVHA